MAMICKAATFQRALAPPQEDFQRPVWTRVTVDGVLLTNSAEYAGWDQSPCELYVCESCWAPSCAMSNLANVACVGDWLVFYPPELSELPSWTEGWGNPSNFLSKTLWFPPSLWDRMRGECESIPTASHFPIITRRGLVSLWLRQMPLGTHHPPGRDDLPKLKDLLLASDPLSESVALSRIDSILSWCDEAPGMEVAGQISQHEEFTGTVNTLHLDGQPSPEWHCFTSGNGLGLALGDDLLFLLD